MLILSIIMIIIIITIIHYICWFLITKFIHIVFGVPMTSSHVNTDSPMRFNDKNIKNTHTRSPNIMLIPDAFLYFWTHIDNFSTFDLNNIFYH